LRTLRATLEYDGSRYGGWQRQDNRVTIQQVFEEALGALTGETISCVAAGRTDAGVHALGQTVSFRTESAIPPRGLKHGGNARLPEDVAIRTVEDASPAFHARRDAKGKHYRYVILNRRTRSPVNGRFTCRLGPRLDEGRMSAAARVLRGRHDFSSFRNAGSVMGSAVRTVTRLDITREGDYLSMDVEGDGFLYRMVRNLAGTLILVGLGKLTPEEVRTILSRRDRRLAGPTAPASGLCLVEVRY
jgi:tRNA pseudouridine38-40 synthase